MKLFINEHKDLQREINLLKKRGGSGASQGNKDPTMCPHYKKGGYHEPDASFDLEKKKDKRPPGWKSEL